MRLIKFSVLIFLTISLAACLPPLPEGYPEHPGEAGKATLSGIDSDGDGVRDDIKIEIFYAYPEDPVARAALEQEAKAFNAALLAGAIENEIKRKKSSLDAAYQISKFVECVFGEVFTDDDSAREDLMSFMEREFINTKQRSDAYMKFNQALSGTTFSDIDIENPCEFDVQTGELLND